ncbi:MAG: (2Fe-2S)-binding protein [Acidobacteria bacterium]|uniref:(2Fe-2S)-binding protein n=1 Tax=Candidatus Polarisedimenticola svalbardensis TaxID=2886004 RepID=A0A8J6Y4Y5_9BACT|nr:(2Fe-2S)-binding protein [Candidatus Polarisedimenticola svalbardensis]
MPTLTINGKKVQAREGAYVLEAARQAGAEIPTLCHFEGLEPWGGCRLCQVQITKNGWDGWKKMVVGCMFPVEEGLIVLTDTDEVRETRRVVLDLLLARCPETPLIQAMAKKYGIERTSYVPNPEPTDCILCSLCTRVCDHIEVSAISTADRGAGKEIAPPFHEPPEACIGCLACAEICPTDFIPFKTSHVSRSIWGKEFEMLRCQDCGRAHITKAQAEHHAAHRAETTGVSEEWFRYCDSCKRKRQAARFPGVPQLA